MGSFFSENTISSNLLTLDHISIINIVWFYGCENGLALEKRGEGTTVRYHEYVALKTGVVAMVTW